MSVDRCVPEGLSDGTVGSCVQAAPVAFRFRLAERRDLPICAELLPAGFRPRAPGRGQLIELWTRLLAAEARCFMVFEDVELPYPDCIEGFGLSVFLAEEFFEAFRAAPRPYVSALVYQRMLAGDEVILSPERLRLAQASSGLHSLALHHGMRNEDLADPRTAQLLAASSEAFFFAHRGYRIASLIAEVYGPQQLRYMEAAGFHTVQDFRRAAPSMFDHFPDEHAPYLVMLRREWIEPVAVDPISYLFAPPAVPRLLFSALERRILERALLNQSDEEIADRIGISRDGIKKAWRNIFARVEQRMPALLPATELDGSRRGPEKRRHLLAYLRLHLNELRPHGSPPLHRRG